MERKWSQIRSNRTKINGFVAKCIEKNTNQVVEKLLGKMNYLEKLQKEMVKIN